MSRWHRVLPRLPFFCCLLTVLASGDDFSLPRVMFPSAFSASTALPLDDPNLDYLAASDSVAVRQSAARASSVGNEVSTNLVIACLPHLGLPAALLARSAEDVPPVERCEVILRLRC
jgi:hypothetical protein